MKTKFIIFYFVLLLLMCCATRNNNASTSKSIEKCGKTYVDDFSAVSYVDQNFVVQNDTIKINSVRFNCTHYASYTSYSMYNLYGEWHEFIETNNLEPRVYLIWNNIDLLSNGNQYTVVTFGVEKVGDIYSAIMVFDEFGKDLLAEDSEHKEKIINFFSSEIRKKKDNKKNSIFYQTYIKKFIPKYWKKYKNFPNVKIYIE